MGIRIHLVITKDTLNPLLTRLAEAIPSRGTEILKEYSDRMVEMARSIVPVRTGFLQSTIHSETIELFHVLFAASACYAGYVEFGTFKMAPRPYMRPSLEAYEQELAYALTSEISDLLKR